MLDDPAALAPAGASRRVRIRLVAVVATLLASAVLAAIVARSPEPFWSSGPSGPFPGSWYTQPLPDEVPSHDREVALLAYLREAPESRGGFLHLATDRWAIPIHHARPGDPEGRVLPLGDFDPPEWEALRIPSRARPAPNDDAEMVVWDTDRGLLVHLFDARWVDGQWFAQGGSVRHLGSNGLPSRVAGHDDPRNVGTSRGNNGLTFGISWQEVEEGAVSHVVKVATGPETSERHVWPMWGSDGDATDPAAPPQGLRLRVRPEVDLEALGLQGQALVIARGLQTHGMYVGDNGGRTSIKLQAHRPWRVDATSLAALPFEPRFWQVLPEGWGQPTGS